MGHDAQLDLRVVRRQQLVAVGRDERLANPAPLGGTHRDVLQVRVARRQTAGRGDRLAVRGVDPPGARVDLLRQAVGVGTFKLAQRAVLHQYPRQRIPLLGQFIQHLLGGGRLTLGGLLQHWQTELVVENRAQLARRAEVEFLARQLDGLAFQFGHLVAQLLALDLQQLGIHQRALALDPRQHWHQWHLDLGQHRGQARNRLQLREQRLVQAQGHVGVFGGIRASLVQSDLVEGQLLGALAGDVLELDRGVLQVLLGQAVHVMTGGRGVEHVGLEHGVEGHAAHGDAAVLVAVEGAVGEDVHVELGVLADLELVRVFQQRLERPQHRIAVQLLRRVGVVMGQRDVRSFISLHREGNANQLRLMGIDPGGFGIEGEQRGVLELLQPDVETCLVEDGLVDRVHRHYHFGCHHRLGRGHGDGQVQFGHRRRLGGTTGLALQFVDPALELQQGVQLQQLFAVRFAQVQVIQADVQFHVALDSGQLVGEKRHLLVLQQLRRQGLGAADRQGRNLVEVLVELFQATVDPYQQPHGGLFAHPFHARDVVGGIAHQRQQVDDLPGGDTEFPFYALDVEHGSGHGVDQRNVLVDQLRHVLVAGGHHHRTGRRRTAAGQGTDHVVSLDPLHAQQREAQGAHGGVQRLDLHAHVVGHARAIGLVVGEQLVAERAALGVEHHGERTLRVLLAQAAEHVQHPLHRAGRQALGRGQRRQRVEGAVEVRRTVYQDERGLAHERNQPFRRARR